MENKYIIIIGIMGLILVTTLSFIYLPNNNQKYPTQEILFNDQIGYNSKDLTKKDLNNTSTSLMGKRIYTVILTGNESILFNYKIEGDNLTLIPIFNGTKVVNTCNNKNNSEKLDCKNITYIQPNQIDIRTSNELNNLPNQSAISLRKGLDNTFRYILDPNLKYTRIGKQSVLIISSRTYSSININITIQANFAHLNISYNPPYDYLVIYYPFDVENNSNAIYDYNIYDNDASIGNTPHTKWIKDSGFYGSAYNFTPTNDGVDRITITSLNVTSIMDNFTVSSWLECNAPLTSSSATAWSFSGPTDHIGFYPCDQSASGVRVFWGGLGNNIIQPSGTPTSGWHLFTLTHITGNTSLYVDGDYVISSSNTGTIGPFTSIILGNYGTEFYKGLIDEVMVFNRSLSTVEVKDIYDNQSNRFYPTGTMNFTGINLGTDTLLNITINSPQRYFNSNITASANGGVYQEVVINATGQGVLNDYTLPYTGSNSYITLKLIAGNQSTNLFYSPVVKGNITLDGFGGAVDSCTYTSGDWVIDAGDNCVISVNQDIGNNKLTCEAIGGSGTLTFDGAFASGVSQFYHKGNECTLIKLNGGGVKYGI